MVHLTTEAPDLINGHPAASTDATLGLTRMDNEEIDLINDEPFGICEDQPGTFLIRRAGELKPFAVVVAEDMEELYWLVDEFGDPTSCECTALISCDGFDFDYGDASEHLEGRLPKRRAWRPVDDGSVRRRDREIMLARAEQEVAELQGILKDLKRKANDRPNGHRRRSRKDAGFVAQAGSGKDQPH